MRALPVAANDNEPLLLRPAGFGQRGFFVPPDSQGRLRPAAKPRQAGASRPV